MRLIQIIRHYIQYKHEIRKKYDDDHALFKVEKKSENADAKEYGDFVWIAHAGIILLVGCIILRICVVCFG